MSNTSRALVVAAMGLLLGAAPALQATGSGLVGYWKLDDLAAANSSTDSSGNLITGSWPNGATPTAPGAPAITFTNPNCLALNGTNQYVDLGNPTAFPAGLSPRTMCGWGKSTTTAAGYRWIFAYGSPGTGQAMFIGMNGPDLVVGGYGDDLTLTGFWDTNWHHIALTYDGTTAILYADGTPRLTPTAKAWNLVRSVAFLGKQANTAAEYWNGQIDDVRLYNRVLSATEIAALAAGQSGPPAPTNLIATPGNAQIVLTWNASANATSYNVKQAVVSGGPYTTIGNVTGTTYTDMGLSNATPYFYVVSAISFGEGPNSTQATATPVAPPPRTQKLGNDNHSCGCSTVGTPDAVVLGAALVSALLLLLLLPRR